MRNGSSNDRLRQARQDANIPSARQAAIRFGWNVSTYASHENGQTPVPMDAAVRYGKALHVSPVWILHGIGGERSIDAMLAGQPEEVWDFVRDMVAVIIKHKAIWQ